MASIGGGAGGALPFPRPATAGAPAGQAQQSFFFPGVQRQVQLGPNRPRPRPNRSAPAVAASAKKQCNCKNSRCLKLYCECFASGHYCDNCNCNNCCNNREHETVRQAAVESILDRNPNAFRPKIAGEEGAVVGGRHNKGCNCKKSGCLKKYCECFQAGIMCSENCKCIDCKNYEGSAARISLAAAMSRQRQFPVGSSLRPGIPLGAGVPAAPRQGMPPSAAPFAGMLPKDLAAMAAQRAAGPSQAQKQAAAKSALQEVIKPEVVEKLAMLLMVVVQEELERRKAGGDEVGGAAAAVAPDALRSEGEASSQAAALHAAQERLVLTEFRDTLTMITRVVAEKVDKRVKHASAQQSVILAAVNAQQQAQRQQAQQLQQQQVQAQQQVSAAAMAQAQAAMAALKGGVPPGMQPMWAMQGGQPQLVLVPQALVAQQQAQQQQQQPQLPILASNGPAATEAKPE